MLKTTETQAEFAKRLKVSRAYITQLKNEGRLVFEKKNGREVVNIEKSLKLIAETGDLRQEQFEPLKEEDKQVLQDYKHNRAMKEYYTACLRKVEYEEKMGNMVKKEGVKNGAFEIGRILTKRIMAIPNRLAPKIVPITKEGEAYKLLTAECKGIITEIQRDLNNLIKTIKTTQENGDKNG